MREIKTSERGTTTYEFVPMPEQEIRERIAAEAKHYTAVFGLTWLDNVDVLGLLDTIEDLRRDNEALKAELTEKGAVQETCEGGC